MTTNLKLGDVVFLNFEIPDQLKGLGGIHQMAEHDYIGPDKDVQMLGPKPHDISWSGTFLYQEAADRARRLDQYRIAGSTLRLSWDVFAYEVVIKDFRFDPRHKFEIPYDIELVVVKDLSGVPPVPIVQTTDEGVLTAFSKTDDALENLQEDSNFAHVELASGTELPTDETTTLAYLKDPIEILPPEGPTVQTLGALG
jgi:hypothetical protein